MPAYQQLTRQVLAGMGDDDMHLLLWWNPSMTCWTVSVLQVGSNNGVGTVGSEELDDGPDDGLYLNGNPVFWLHEAQSAVVGAGGSTVSELAETVSTAIVGMNTRVRLTREHMIRLPATETRYVMVGRSGPEQCTVGASGKMGGRKVHWLSINNEKCEVVYGADDVAFVVHNGRLADVYVMA